MCARRERRGNSSRTRTGDLSFTKAQSSLWRYARGLVFWLVPTNSPLLPRCYPAFTPLLRARKSAQLLSSGLWGAVWGAEDGAVALASGPAPSPIDGYARPSDARCQDGHPPWRAFAFLRGTQTVVRVDWALGMGIVRESYTENPRLSFWTLRGRSLFRVVHRAQALTLRRRESR